MRFVFLMFHLHKVYGIARHLPQDNFSITFLVKCKFCPFLFTFNTRGGIKHMGIIHSIILWTLAIVKVLNIALHPIDHHCWKKNHPISHTDNLYIAKCIKSFLQNFITAPFSHLSHFLLSRELAGFRLN